MASKPLACPLNWHFGRIFPYSIYDMGQKGTFLFLGVHTTQKKKNTPRVFYIPNAQEKHVFHEKNFFFFFCPPLPLEKGVICPFAEPVTPPAPENNTNSITMYVIHQGKGARGVPFKKWNEVVGRYVS